MTIQRQYSLPNCTLTLEGFGDGTSNAFDLRPVMAILTSAECKLVDRVLRGGKDFLEGLMIAASRYAQEILSGIHVPAQETAGTVSFSRLGPDQHQLTFTPEEGEAQTATLNTVQLFDLVEAIDQFIADTQTLPNWSPGLRPASKKFAPREPISKQAVPLATGIGGLLIAAAAFAALPTPQIKQPDNLTYAASPSASPAASPSPNAGVSPSASPSPSVSPSAAVSPSPTASPSPTDSPTASNAPEITDVKQIEGLSSELQKQLQIDFKGVAGVTQPLTYRVTVGQDGKVLGYRADDTVASDFANQTNLPKLTFVPAPDAAPSNDPIASLRAVFLPDGTVKVTPWAAPVATANASPEATASPAPTESPSGTTNSGTSKQIAETAKLKELQPKLYDTIDQQWTTEAGFKENLTFRVRVNGAGQVIDYEPSNQAAIDYSQETPLPKLGKLSQGDQLPQEEFATFKVVFTPEGRLQINPWDGYPGN